MRSNRLSQSSTPKLLTVIVATLLLILIGCAQLPREKGPKAEIGYVDIEAGITLRRMIVTGSEPKGTVLLLHGFPETLFAWKDVSMDLARDYEVHAFDWPGYGFSSRPPADQFSYAPADYARVLMKYIENAKIDKSTLIIYATDIGALPPLLLALDDPNIAKKIIVGDFAPLDRPQHMYDSLKKLKSNSSSGKIHAYMNSNKDEILENAFRRGLSKHEQFDVHEEFREDMLLGWSVGGMTSADAFYLYYSHFTRDQLYLESNLHRLRTPVRVIWGERDVYINTEMGVEFARRIGADLCVLDGIGHYPHLQSPNHTIDLIRASFDHERHLGPLGMTTGRIESATDGRSCRH